MPDDMFALVLYNKHKFYISPLNGGGQGIHLMDKWINKRLGEDWSAGKGLMI